MVIKTTYEALVKAVSTLKSVVNVKIANDTLKNYIFKIAPDNTVRMLTYNTIVMAYTELAVTDIQDNLKSDSYFQIKADVLDKLLTALGHLSRTVITEIAITPDDINTVFTVTERDNANTVNETKFRLASPKLLAGIRTQIDIIERSIPKNNTETDVPTTVLKEYIDILLKTITDDKDNIATRITFNANTVFTAPQTHFAMLENKLSDTCNDFVLSKTAAVFLSDALKSAPDTIKFTKAELENQLVLIKLSCDAFTAYIQAKNLSNALDCTAYKSRSNTYIEIDKTYMLDIFKRFMREKEPCAIDISIFDNKTSFVITTEELRQTVPVLSHNLDLADFADSNLIRTDADVDYVKINFAIAPELLKQLIFIHFKHKDSDKLRLYFSPALNNGVKLACCDNTGIWQTKINSLMPKRGSYNW